MVPFDSGAGGESAKPTATVRAKPTPPDAKKFRVNQDHREERLLASKIELLLLILITAAGAAARFLKLQTLPLGAAGTEEGTSWLATAGFLHHGYPLLPSGLAYWKGFPYTFLAGSISAVFGLSAWSLRVPSALFGAAAIPAAWWATRLVLRRLSVSGWAAAVGGLLAAYMLAFSEWCLLMSRWGRFYAMGMTLFLVGVGLAAWGFSPSRSVSTRTVAVFGALVLVASATFHPGGLLLVAPLAAWVLGTRLGAKNRRILAAFLASTALWFLGVLFLWKSGHVGASSGWRDLLLMVGLPFWKHMGLLLVVGLGGWWAIVTFRVRAEPEGSMLPPVMSAQAADSVTKIPSSTPPDPGKLRWLSLAAVLTLLLLEAIVFVAAGLKGVDTGALQGFHILALGHPGVMVIALVGTIALVLASRRASSEGARAAGLLWLMTMIPIALVGASTGHFVPRYLLFTFGPLALCAGTGLALLLNAVGRSSMRWVVAAALVPAALWMMAPAVSPVAGMEMLDHRIGQPWPPLLACSPSRAYALDLESPSRYVADRLRPGDLVVSTARSIPEAVIGHMDYFFRVPSASNTLLDETGGPFNILTGCPMISQVDQVLELCADKRVFVILDERALQLKEVRALKDRLVDILGSPAFKSDEYAEVYLLPPGCHRSANGPEPSRAAPAEGPARTAHPPTVRASSL